MPHLLLSGLPEEVNITQEAVQSGYAAVALSSQMRQQPRCWDTSWPPTSGSDFPMVLATFMYALVATPVPVYSVMWPARHVLHWHHGL